MPTARPGCHIVCRPNRSRPRVFLPRDVGRIARYCIEDGGTQEDVCEELLRNGVQCCEDDEARRRECERIRDRLEGLERQLMESAQELSEQETREIVIAVAELAASFGIAVALLRGFRTVYRLWQLRNAKEQTAIILRRLQDNARKMESDTQSHIDATRRDLLEIE